MVKIFSKDGIDGCLIWFSTFKDVWVCGKIWEKWSEDI